MPSRRRPLLAVASAAVAAVALVGCADDQATDYTAATRSDFLAGCADVVADATITVGLCECVFRGARERIPYAEFAAFDDQLKELPSADLPPELLAVVVDCIEDAYDL